MQVETAVITMGGKGTRMRPITYFIPKEMLPIGAKPALYYLLQECRDSGIKKIILVRSSDVPDSFIEHIKSEFRDLEFRCETHFEQNGLGTAVLRALLFNHDIPFALLLGDSLYKAPVPPIKQLLETFETEQASVVGMSFVGLEKAKGYGVVMGAEKQANWREIKSGKRVVAAEGFAEKPEKPTSPYAISARYVLTPSIWNELYKIKRGYGDEYQLTDALDFFAKKELVLAQEIDGVYHDIGTPAGYIKAFKELT